MASPSEMIGWECGACTYTNDDCTRRDCLMCMTERPKRYFVMPGAGASATARTTTVDRREQARLAAAHDVDEDDAPPPVEEEPIINCDFKYTENYTYGCGCYEYTRIS